MGWLSGLSTGLSIVLISPLVYVASVGYFLLVLLAAPVIKICSVVLHLVLIPLRILSKFEALFIYLGVALLTGVGLGVFLYLATTFTVHLLNRALGASSRTRPGLELRSKDGLRRPLKDAKTVYQGDSTLSNDDSWMGWGWQKEASLLNNGGLLSGTILEEEEESSQDSNFESKS
ncbi:hypothetical protein P175DRAFT_0525531 [Aspergillus ochraceoroseus IBT 24754]|uniref:Uncharacterized protein n=1 Tax=Aspergillus ochraceoroseus IBT 24754 TaxID=1392256 RepID=A0A2T5LR37_9EURO|nr:uncharacterized protein P175DRAFT_0525531 [Aspergillus ochraceoroseus IBT 24754]PTU18750.1 hypothetical protein P175DRAFT_0525531 [Aspergillus ochraceoroseus IBT 24754]